MTQQILQVYKEFNVEILVESTVKSEADMTKVMSFLQSAEQQQTSTTTATAAAAAAATASSTIETDSSNCDMPTASKKQKLTAK
jgi:cytoskeletal protein RodZ